jgi:hypothetical protein
MRAGEGEKDFAEWLLKLGNGELKVEFGEDIIKIPDECIVKDDLIDEMYNTNLNIDDIKHICIFCPKNDNVDFLNGKILHKILKTDSKKYTSIDNVLTDDEEERNNFPIEFLNSITPSGMPPHELELKVGAPVMILRNLNASKGQCNGTRAIVKGLHENMIDVEIIAGANAGQRVFLSRITLSTKGTDLPFILNRRQFPIKLAFCMTINKSQGQTFKKIGIYLPQPVFSHGQLYVAFSRVSKMTDVKIKIENYVKQGRLKNDDQVYTRNIVYKELL